MDEAIARVSAARAAGADASFVEAPGSVEQLAEIGRRAPAPNVANMLPGGKTPLLPKEQLAEMGFHLILHPLTGLFAAASAMVQVCEKLRDDGHTQGLQIGTMPFAEFNELMEIDRLLARGERLESREP
jgi:2-methylisocitrate lyase-like PEP mutase family enzyme